MSRRLLTLVGVVVLAAGIFSGGRWLARSRPVDDAFLPDSRPATSAPGAMAGLARATLAQPTRPETQDDPVTQKNFDETVEAWIQRDPAAAAHWLDTLPDGRERAAGLGRAVTQWSGLDPIAAGAFVATMPAGPAREQAIAVHVGILKIENPRVAALWLATLPADDQPLGLIEEIAGDWVAINRADAEIWLAQTPLPAERRQRVLAATARDAQ